MVGANQPYWPLTREALGNTAVRLQNSKRRGISGTSGNQACRPLTVCQNTIRPKASQNSLLSVTFGNRRPALRSPASCTKRTMGYGKSSRFDHCGCTTSAKHKLLKPSKSAAPPHKRCVGHQALHGSSNKPRRFVLVRPCINVSTTSGSARPPSTSAPAPGGGG